MKTYTAEFSNFTGVVGRRMIQAPNEQVAMDKANQITRRDMEFAIHGRIKISLKELPALADVK